MNKLGNVEYKILFEYLHNIVFLSKKGRKSGGIILNFENQMINSLSNSSDKEPILIQKLFTEDVKDFLSLNYPTNSFKSALILNIYPIPLSTVVVLMIYQRICRLSIKNAILLLLLLAIIFLFILIIIDYFLNKIIKKSRLYLSSKTVPTETQSIRSKSSEHKEEKKGSTMSESNAQYDKNRRQSKNTANSRFSTIKGLID